MDNEASLSWVPSEAGLRTRVFRSDGSGTTENPAWCHAALGYAMCRVGLNSFQMSNLVAEVEDHKGALLVRIRLPLSNTQRDAVEDAFRCAWEAQNELPQNVQITWGKAQ